MDKQIEHNNDKRVYMRLDDVTSDLESLLIGERVTMDLASRSP